MRKKEKNKSLFIRVAQQDIDMLESQAKELKISKSELIRLHIHNKEAKELIVRLNQAKAMQLKILLEISRVAGNINQIAYHLNAGKMQGQQALPLFLKQAQNAKLIFNFFKKEAKKSLEQIEKVYS